MSELRERLTRVDWIKWVSLSVPIIGTIWGVWEFFLKEIVLPSLTPANINMEVNISPLPPLRDGSRPLTSKAQPVELSLTVTSTGKHTLRVINPYWIAYGNTLEMSSRDASESQQEIAARINEQLGPNQAAQSSRPNNYHYGPYILLRKLIGVGTLFIGEEIKPEQVIHARRIIFVQPDAQDFLQLFVYIPTIRKQPNDRLDDVKVAVMNSGPPFYSNNLYFCHDRSTQDPPRSILQRLGVRLSSSDKDNDQQASRRRTCQFLDRKERDLYGAQIATSVYEKMLTSADPKAASNAAQGPAGNQ